MADKKKLILGVVACVCELIVGILLLINPEGFTAGILIVFGILLCLWGLYSIFNYFRADPAAAALSQSLSKGIIALLLGLFCALNYAWFLNAFPIIARLYGVAILLLGITKIQRTVDLFRLHAGGWGWTAISALAALIFALLILANPFGTVHALWIFAGISIIVEAILDGLALFLGGEIHA